jgi:hypothetical protein
MLTGDDEIKLYEDPESEAILVGHLSEDEAV